MSFVNSFPLGIDMAWTLIAVVLVGIAVLTLGALLPRRWGRTVTADEPVVDDEDLEALDDDPTADGAETDGGTSGRASADADDASDDEDAEHDGREPSGIGQAIALAARTALVVGIPAALLLLLIQGSLDVRILRSAMVVLGILAGIASAWRAASLVLSAGALAPERRASANGWAGALLTSGAIAIAVVPIGVSVAVLRADSGTALLAFAAGAALFALAGRVTGGFADVTASAATLLAGADESDHLRGAPENPGAYATRLASALRRGPALAADITAGAAAVTSAGIAIGVATFAVEGMLVPILGAGFAMLAALLAAGIGQMVHGEGRERTRLSLPSLLSSVIGAGLLAATVAMWLPTTYKALRFAAVGLGSFTDPALTGGQPIPRAQLEPQIEQARAQLPQMIEQFGDGPGGRGVLDTLAVYGVQPGAAASAALAVGAITALLVQWLVGYAVDRRSTPVLAQARTSRTGGPLGALAGIGTSALAAVGTALILVAALAVLGILAGGISMLAFMLVAFAGTGALVVVAGSSAMHTARLVLDEDDIDAADRDAARPAEASGLAGVHTLLALGALPVLATLTNAVLVTKHAKVLWEDRALTDMTPASLLALGGLAIGIVAPLAVGAWNLEALRRLGASSVLNARERGEDSTDQVDLIGALPLARRAIGGPLLVAVVLPVLVGFSLGLAALPMLVAGVVLSALVWAVGTSVWDSSSEAALDVIETGRYGGVGSWGHSGALGSAATATGLRAGIGGAALPFAVVVAYSSALLLGAVATLSTDGTTPEMRWLIAVAAVLVIGVGWGMTRSVPEPDLEDVLEEDDAPLFAAIDPATGRGEADESAESDAGADATEVRPRRGSRRARRGRG